MAYLNLQGGPAFPKATISIWFRVPQTSIDDAIADWKARQLGGSLDIRFAGVVPIISWGPDSVFTTYSGGGSTAQISPSFIGVQVSDPDYDPVIAIRFQSSSLGSLFTPLGHVLDVTSGVVYNIGFQAGIFQYPSIIGVKNIHVTPDKWHQLIVSFDVTGGDTGKLWVAFDDHNYDSAYFWPAGAACLGAGGPNDIFSNIKINETINPGTTSGSFSFESHPFGIPVPSPYSAFNGIIELAEFQLFVGVTADTSSSAIRHMFIKDGKPVDPSGTANRHLSKDPDILLHGVGNWRQGRNTGLSPAQFTHFGHINKFKPEPKLGD